MKSFSQVIQPVEYKKRSLEDRKMSTVSSGATLSVYESDVSWVSASYAFDRLCMLVAMAWHIFLFIGLVAGFNSN